MADVWQRTAPLSHRQERTRLPEGLHSGSRANNLAFVHWIDGDLDRPALEAAIAEVHRRHAVSTPDGHRLPWCDLSAHADPAGEVRRLLDEAVRRPCDPGAETPVRWTLYALGPGRHALARVVHHAAGDAWATEAIDADLFVAYETYAGDRTARCGPTERTVAALVTELLGHERIGVDDNFFALGGSSLQAARLVALVRKEFHVELTLLDLFANPTVAGVAAFIEGVSGAAR